MIELEMDNYDSFYGSHRGIADWYPALEAAIREALEKGPEFHWTVRWSSKHQIVSARLSCHEGAIWVGVSVSDDFGSIGEAEDSFEFSREEYAVDEMVGKIQMMLWRLWHEADKGLLENALYIGFTLQPMGSTPGAAPFTSSKWYIAPSPINEHPEDGPPGDNYFEWGWQDDVENDEWLDEWTVIEAEWWIHEYINGNTPEAYRDLQHREWRIRPWNEANGD